MSCEQWQERIAEEIGGEFSAQVKEHLDACPDCFLLAEELENDRHALATAPADAAHADYTAMRPRIRSAILRERRLRRYVPAMAAAAAAVLAIALIQPRTQPALQGPPPIQHALYTTSEVPAPVGGVCISLPSPSCRGTAGGEVHSSGGQAKACPTSDEALTQELSASCPAMPAAPLPVSPRPRIRKAVTPPIDLALLRKVTGRQTVPDTGSESPVEMQIATGNPDVTIILLQAKEGSYE